MQSVSFFYHFPVLRSPWHRSWSASSGSRLNRLFGSREVLWKLHCYQPYTSESSQEFNDDGTNPRRRMTIFCWWVAFPLQNWQSWFTPTGEIFKIRQDLIDALHCRSCFGAQVLLKNLCLFVMFASQFLPSQIGQSCHSCQGMRHKIELVPAGFVPRLAPIAFGECQFSS